MRAVLRFLALLVIIEQRGDYEIDRYALVAQKRRTVKSYVQQPSAIERTLGHADRSASTDEGG